MASKGSMKNVVDGAVTKTAKGMSSDEEGSSIEGSPKDISAQNEPPSELQTKSKVPADPKTPAKGTMRKAAVAAAPSTPNVDTRELFRKNKGQK